MMTPTIPNHLSNNLEFFYQRRKSFLTDRISIYRLMPGIVFGFLLCLLGIYEWLHFFRNGGDDLFPTDFAPVYQPGFSIYVFDLCFILVGLSMVVANILLYIRYNKYKFSSGKVTILKRPIFRDKIVIEEDLKNYAGVRFRIEFFQTGFLLKNRYVIELYHKNPEKIIPLYLSTSGKGVRTKWKDYAKAFKLPAMLNTDKGLKSIDLKNLNKSLKSQYKLGLISDTYDAYDLLPPTIAFVRKKDKMVLKIRKIVWDAYNMMAWAAVLLVLAFVFWTLSKFGFDKRAVCSACYALPLGGLLLVAVAIQLLFRKEKLVLKKHKIVHTHKYMLFSTKHNEIMKNDIEELEVAENPATGRCFVSIISDDNIIAFGTKLPIKDLQWIKRFLIHEIVNP